MDDCCIVCLEAVPNNSSLLCSKKKHRLCFGADCVLGHAESPETLARTSAGTVPCCGSSQTPPECRFDDIAFLEAVMNASAVNHAEGNEGGQEVFFA